MMLLQWFVLTMPLFIDNGIAASYHSNDFIDDNPAKELSSEGCRADLLLLLDFSNSVGKRYIEDVKKFLKRLVTHPRLNMQYNDETGTRVGIITFADEDNTKVLRKIGEIGDAGQFVTWVDWEMAYKDNPKGGFTFTGKAFKLANQAFPEKSPMNYRIDADDVVLLVTNGDPRPDRNVPRDQNQRVLAEEYSGEMKKRNIRIIGVGVGSSRSPWNLNSVSRKYAIPDLAHNRHTRRLNSLVNRIVTEICNVRISRECGCREESLIVDLPQGAAKVQIKLPKPKGPTCPHTSSKLNPDLGETREFGPGETIVMYKYRVGKPSYVLQCPMKINVKGRCECNASNEETVYVPHGEKVDPYWVPLPDDLIECDKGVNALPDIPTPPGDLLARREPYDLKYRFTYREPNTNVRVSQTCIKNVLVKTCPCPVTKIIQKKLPVGKARVTVKYPKLRKLNCSKWRGDPENYSQGEFGLGIHSAPYIYILNSGGVEKNLVCYWVVKILRCNSQLSG